MSRALFKYCKNNLHAIRQGKLKITSSLKSLNRDFGFGTLDDRFCYFTEKDKQLLIDRVQNDLQVHLFRENYPEQQSRIKNAQTARNEKVGALKVSEGFVLLNSLNSLCLNHKVSESCRLSSLGNFIYASEVESIEHQQIILVENLAVMANLSRLNIPESLKEALWVYRGDVQTQQQTGTANQFFKRFKESNQLICFSDFDPAGLQIALSCGAEKWLALARVDDLKMTLSGIEHEWFNQNNAISFINKQEKINNSINRLFSAMNSHQKTLKQEHMIEHSLPLTLYPLF